MTAFPRLALSIRQPWAWAIVHAGKDIENRDWFTHHRGPICIHAAKGNTWPEWDDALFFMMSIDVHPPFRHAIERGGIIGTAEIVDCVSASRSPWFFGKWGFVLANVQPVEFIPAKGALGFFEWHESPVAPAERTLL